MSVMWQGIFTGMGAQTIIIAGTFGLTVLFTRWTNRRAERRALRGR